MKIAGKVFVVTGAGNGIGRQVVLDLVQRGARVAAVDRRQESLNETQALVPAGAISLHDVDITDREAVAALPQQVLAAHGQVDGLVNVAGVIQRFVPVAELDLSEIDRVMAINFQGTLLMDKAFLPLLLARNESSLVNVSSMGALVPVPGQGAYGASKAAVALLTATLFAELKGTPVAVTLVYPGAVATQIAANSGVDMSRLMPATGDAPKMTPAPEAARQIVDAIERGTYRVRIGSDARMLDRLGRLMPTRSISIIANKMKDLLAHR